MGNQPFSDGSAFARFTDLLTTGPGFSAGILAYLVLAVSLFAIAQQEREDFSWLAFVPFLNLLLMCKLGKVNPFLLLLLFVPCVNFFVYAWLWAKVGESRGKAIWGWLTLVPCFIYVSPLVIAFGKSS